MSSKQPDRIKENQYRERDPRMERQNRNLPAMINTSQRNNPYQLAASQGYPHGSPTYTSAPDMYPNGITSQADAYHDPYGSSYGYPGHEQNYSSEPYSSHSGYPASSSPPSPGYPSPPAYPSSAGYTSSVGYPQSSSGYPSSLMSNYLPPMQEPSRYKKESESSAGYGQAYPHVPSMSGYPEMAANDYQKSSLPRTVSQPQERSGKVPKRRSPKPRYGFNQRNAILIGCFADWPAESSQNESEEPAEGSKPPAPKPEKRHICDYQDCERAIPGNGFTTPNDLERHKRSVHKEKGQYFQCRDPACTDSGKYFARRDNFVDHCRRMHKFENMSDDQIKSTLARFARDWISIKDEDGHYFHQGTDILPPPY